MKTLNKVQLIGIVGNLEVKDLENEKKVAKLSLATHYKDAKKETATEWHNVSAWSGVATVIEKYVEKGSSIYIEGYLKNSKYEDKEGNNRTYTEVVAENIILLGDKKK